MKKKNYSTIQIKLQSRKFISNLLTTSKFNFNSIFKQLILYLFYQNKVRIKPYKIYFIFFSYGLNLIDIPQEFSHLLPRKGLSNRFTLPHDNFDFNGIRKYKKHFSFLSEQNSQNDGLNETSQYFLSMSLIGVTRSMTTNLIAEKSTRQKEIQKIMGVTQLGYVLGWFLTNLVRMFIVIVVFLVFSLSTDVFYYSTDLTQTISAYILFGFAQMSISYFISVFFTDPNAGGQVSMLFSVVGSLGLATLQLKYVRRSSWVLYFLSLIPPFAYGIQNILSILNQLAPNELDFTIGSSFAMLGFDVILYSVLFLYLDLVFPNEYGSQKHPLFFLGFGQSKKIPKKDNNEQSLLEIDNINENLMNNSIMADEDNSSAIYHEVFDNKNQLKRSVQITGLSKKFDDLQAVDKVSLNLYESQVLTLLGHNGAGKTTTISLLTGLIKKDSGAVMYYDLSMDQNLDEIRQFTGICPQKDVCYDLLTVEEQVTFFARLKGVPEHQVQYEVAQVINKCALSVERSKYAKNLSGGNRRKLCLAMAIIGNSKVIFLDEPTSGMDPVSRRKIWDILQKLKSEGKTLILTTHHLDEAEVLSERIAIMAKGRLLTVGSTDFIKKNFGIGYNLNIYTVKDQSDQWVMKQERLKKFVKEKIPDSKLNPQSSPQCLSIQLPFNSKDQFIEIFEVLEKDPSIKIDLLMNTLEEAFINIGMDEEKFMKQTRKYSELSNSIKQEEVVQEEIEIAQNDFSSIVAPECIQNAPQYSFQRQFIAGFLRKSYTLKGKRLVFQTIVPVFYLTFGCLLCLINKNSSTWQAATVNTLGPIIIISTCFQASSIGGSIVLERTNKLKYALNVMGMRTLPYWLSTWLFDIFSGLILEAVLLIFVFALGITAFQNINAFILVFLGFMANSALVYFIQWGFHDFMRSVKMLALLMMMVFFILPYTIYQSVDTNPPVLRYIIIIFFPSINLMEGLEVLVNKNNPILEYSLTHFWPYECLLIIQAIFYFSLSLLIDKKELKATPLVSQHDNNSFGDPDVYLEAQRVQQANCRDRVKAINITKTFSNGFRAVKGTSFGVERAQIFGLLGPNGAGKSTTFNMITSRLKPSAGSIYLENQLAEKGKFELYQNVGICPQFDTIWENMTVYQHLKIYGLLKGLNDKDLQACIEYFLQVMQLQDYRDKFCGTLSGGNKRKVCVATALMGGTNMQFYDEPSSGVDPIARRFLWNSIQQGIKLQQGAVVLTTHTMDEAESLCTKIAIQVNGKFACMGSPQELKQKFGQGYRITVDLVQKEFEPEVIKLVSENFPNSNRLPEESQNRITFKVASENFSFFESFKFFKNQLQMEKQLIQDFEINQSSLEQVFMYFASLQESTQQDQVLNISQNKGCFSGCTGNDEDD